MTQFHTLSGVPLSPVCFGTMQFCGTDAGGPGDPCRYLGRASSKCDMSHYQCASSRTAATITGSGANVIE